MSADIETNLQAQVLVNKGVEDRDNHMFFVIKSLTQKQTILETKQENVDQGFDNIKEFVK